MNAVGLDVAKGKSMMMALRPMNEAARGKGSILKEAAALIKIAEKYGVCHRTLQKWLLNYELFGEVELQQRLQNQHYVIAST